MTDLQISYEAAQELNKTNPLAETFIGADDPVRLEKARENLRQAADLINGSMDFESTPEGHAFWSYVFYRLAQQTQGEVALAIRDEIFAAAREATAVAAEEPTLRDFE